MGVLDFYRISPASATKVAPDKIQKVYKRQRMQTFLAATFGYALYYVCRLSMGVMKQPIIDAGLLNATQLGIVGACLYWTYAVGKLANGFLADSANIKRFMATGIIISVGMNFIMGVLGVGALNGTIANSVLFISFCVFWAINGFAQSMGAPASIVSLSR
ncbi:MAG: MFS transporter, partial [Bacteroidales bacterium]|nr:MFS transporter [Bacteroidales bacterium]